MSISPSVTGPEMFAMPRPVAPTTTPTFLEVLLLNVRTSSPSLLITALVTETPFVPSLPFVTVKVSVVLSSNVIV